MRAAYFDRHGGTELIQVGDLPQPEIGPEDVLIRVRAASLNGFDPMILQGTTELKTPMPMIPLGDCAGEVAEVGSDVTDWKIGDRVCPMPFVPTEGMTGETRHGTASEYTRFPAANLMTMPDAVSFEDAACLPIAYGTAYRMMFDRAQVKPGEKVLILGATGGVGVCAVKLAKSAGCEVIACGSSEWKMQRLRGIGADHVVNTTSEDFYEIIKSLYGKPKMVGGGGVDVVINYIGGDTWVPSLKCLRRGGKLLTCGATAGFNPVEDIRYIWTFELNVMGSNGWTWQDQEALLDLVAKGELKPLIHQFGGLEDVASSIQMLIDREVFGKIVITP